MRLLLIHQYQGRKEKLVFPLGLHSLSNYLYHSNPGFFIKIHDMNLDEDPFNKLENVISDFAPDVIGISLRCVDTKDSEDIFHYYASLNPLLKKIKSSSNKPIIIGGQGFSIYAADIIIGNPEIDFGVLIEAEVTFEKLLLNLSDPENVPGIYYRKKNEVKTTGKPEYPDIHAHKTRTSHFIDLKSYAIRDSILGVEIKRGSPFFGDYCNDGFLNGNKIRLRNTDTVLDEIEDLVKNHGIKKLFFVDPHFNFPEDNAQKICEGIIKRKLDFKWNTKFHPKYINRESLILALKTGCSEFHFTLQYFDNNVLKTLNQEYDEKDIRKVYNFSRKTDKMTISLEFLVSPPGETFIGFIKHILFIFRWMLFLRKRLVKITMHNIKLEPYSSILQKAIDDRIITEEHHLLPRDELYLSRLFYINPRTKYIDTFIKTVQFLLKTTNKNISIADHA
jgi:anaerobic magnesium-protoporphyrin IX monomethyl ester cyclase